MAIVLTTRRAGELPQPADGYPTRTELDPSRARAAGHPNNVLLPPATPRLPVDEMLEATPADG